MHKRSKEQIITQILDICCEGASKSTIVYKIGSNSANVNTYMRLLTKNKLIKASNKSYMTTSKGMEILENLKKIQAALGAPNEQSMTCEV